MRNDSSPVTNQRPKTTKPQRRSTTKYTRGCSAPKRVGKLLKGESKTKASGSVEGESANPESSEGTTVDGR
jgi:hypothetical protein